MREVRELDGRDRRRFGTFGNAPPLPARRPGPGLPPRYPDVRVRRGRPELRRGRRRRPRRPARGRPDRAAGRRPRARRARRRSREEMLYVCADPERVSGADDDRAARRGAADPLRRALGRGRPDAPPARRARPAGGRDDRAGDRGRVPRRPRSTSPRAGSATRSGPAASRSAARLRAAPAPASRFDPPIYDTFAFITRRNAHLSPATRAFMELAEKRDATRWAEERDTIRRMSPTRHRRRRGVPRRPSSGSRRPGCR